MKVCNTSVRLKSIMQERNLKQVDILRMSEPYCRKYNVRLNKNDLSQYVSGKVEPGQSKLFILGKTLNVSEAWLMGFDVPRTNISFDGITNIIPLPETKVIPLVGQIACGAPILAEQNITEYLAVDKKIPADFALTCKGDSMINARIYDGDVVYIRIQPDVENGEIAAVRIGEEATLKKVRKFPNKLVLSPCNPIYDDLVYTDSELLDVAIIGKAVAFTSKL